ncbi:MAG: hypothetical protein CMK55_00400 [Proteobacteria bacterium]|nr:hypothetical protein [Pseudomonadota bacterium]RZO99060.1 MAG: CPBP family intramembrane metalloprotease [Gammaproteobacteria bacterium]|tara:strand:- start:1154 stop:1765 length:612 start_codon:yes stop_codon:yes gene_type:complete
MNKREYAIPEGRLQRASLKTDKYISKFRQVLLRHGLTMTSIAIFCCFLTFIPSALVASLNSLFAYPSSYFFYSFIVIIIIFLYLKFTKREFNYRQLLWIGYLLVISIVEEIAFRLSIPLLTINIFGVSYLSAIFLSNVLFAAIHYFTLRWKLSACILAFFGGMGFSRLFSITDDLALVIILHWAVTFLNTPSAPKANQFIEKN